ncbi:MAG: fibronectin type III domain-containing protein, partial [Methanomassiliicoccales archaeon]|nr:fibronectin type III domain-containing protein [Methanomassiliicoccales archaeon]
KVDLQGCGEHISMAMDGLGRMHISYFDPVGENLMYASAITIPSTPMNLTASVSDGTVTLHWEAPANNGGANITQYAIYRGGSENGLTLYTIVSGSITNYVDTGLENGVTLVYRIRAVNSEGSSPYSNSVEATPCSEPGAPDVKASGRDKAVQLSWDEPDNGGAEILEYRIYRKNETGVFHQIATVDGIETSYKDVDLENGAEYFYYVTAVNPAGESTPSATASATANPDSTWMIIVVVIVVVAAIGVGAFLFLRQKGKF